MAGLYSPESVFLESKVTKQQWPNSLRDYVYPKIGSVPVNEIGIHEVLSVLKPIWSKKTTTAALVLGVELKTSSITPRLLA